LAFLTYAAIKSNAEVAPAPICLISCQIGTPHASVAWLSRNNPSTLNRNVRFAQWVSLGLLSGPSAVHAAFSRRRLMIVFTAI